MSGITGEFVAKLAKVWHRFTLPGNDRNDLAKMLRPMDDAGEEVSQKVLFDMEPSDFNNALSDQASHGRSE